MANFSPRTGASGVNKVDDNRQEASRRLNDVLLTSSVELDPTKPSTCQQGRDAYQKVDRTVQEVLDLLAA
jgi:hypothetical protein